MPVIRTFIGKVKPGRMQDAVTALGTLKRLSIEAGATHCTAYNVITGPLFPGLTIHLVCNDFAAFGAAREKVLANPESAQFFAEDAPIETANALLAEPVYTAGDVASIIGQTKVRFTLTARPHRGRHDDAVRRGSRLADTIHQCGALAASLRRVIAGIDGSMFTLHSYHAGFAELDATRNAVLESDVWSMLQNSQDKVVTRGVNIVSVKLDI
jgi:hypothetical protein